MSADPRFWLAVTLAVTGALLRALWRVWPSPQERQELSRLIALQRAIEGN